MELDIKLHGFIPYNYPRYAVTKDGKVWNTKRHTFQKLNHNHRGYWQVKLCEKGKYKSFLVHRLVAEAYLEKPKGATIVNHKDGNKKNNHVDNLEWCTAQDNTDHAMLNGNFKAKLTPEDVTNIRKAKGSYSEIAKQYGVSKRMVYLIVTRQSWKHLP